MIDLVRAIGATRAARTENGDVARARDRVTSAAEMRTGMDLRAKLAKCVSAIDLEDPQSMRQGRRETVRTILLWEFGDAFADDPQFLAVQDAIDSVMEADEQAAAQFMALVKVLRLAKS